MKADIKKMTAMRTKGASLEEIGREFGLSRQRVYQKLVAAHGTANLQPDKLLGIEAEIATLKASLKVQRARLKTVRKAGLLWEMEGIQEAIASLEGRLRDATRVNGMLKPEVAERKEAIKTKEVSNGK